MVVVLGVDVVRMVEVFKKVGKEEVFKERNFVKVMEVEVGIDLMKII